jgi:ribosomal protein S18 acetylase RimI-like enzyme
MPSKSRERPPGEWLVIKAIDEREIENIYRIYLGCEDFLALGPQPKASREMVMKDLEDSKRHNRAFCGIYEGQGGMVGIVDYALGGYEGRRGWAYLALLMIATDQRGRGIGSRVVKLVESEIMKDPGITRICSGVQVNNTPAIAFWRKMGYRVCGGPDLMPDRTTVYHLEKKLDDIKKIPPEWEYWSPADHSFRKTSPPFFSSTMITESLLTLPSRIIFESSFRRLL